MIPDASSIERVQGVVDADVDDLRVLLNDNLDYVGLDAVGASVWEHLREPTTMGGLVAALVDSYGIDAETCRRDITPFLRQLEELRLVVIA